MSTGSESGRLRNAGKNANAFTSQLDPRISSLDHVSASANVRQLSETASAVENMDSVGKMTVQTFYLRQLYNPDSELFAHLETVYKDKDFVSGEKLDVDNKLGLNDRSEDEVLFADGSRRLSE